MNSTAQEYQDTPANNTTSDDANIGSNAQTNNANTDPNTQTENPDDPNTPSVLLDVPMVCQFPLAPTGCEIACLTMLLLYDGYDTTLQQSIDEMWYSYDDPSYGFVGDPEDWDGWTIYPEAAGEWLAERLGSYIDLTGADFETIRQTLREGKPVMAWIVNPDIGEHCVCICGYDDNGFYCNDPYGTKDWYCDYDSFAEYWAEYDYMALTY